MLRARDRVGGAPCLVGPAGVLWSLQLDFESLHANLEPIHGLNGRLRAGWVVKADKSWK